MDSRKPLSIRQLSRGDEAELEYLALHDAEFDIPGRGGPRQPLNFEQARAYLSDPDVLFWVAIQGGSIVGFLSCHIVPKRAGPPRELFLYEIGVHARSRLRGIGRLLVTEMEAWMRSNRIAEVWVLSDNRDAESFYQACGFAVEAAQPKYLTKQVG